MIRANLMDRKMHDMLIICTESLEDLYLYSPFSGLRSVSKHVLYTCHRSVCPKKPYPMLVWGHVLNRLILPSTNGFVAHNLFLNY